MRALVSVAVLLIACSGTPAPVGPPPTPSALSKRIVVEPEALVMVLSEDQELETPRPIAASLGATVGPRARILMKLPKPAWHETVTRAWLVIDRAEFAQAGPSDVTIRAEKIVEPWSAKGGAGTTWANPPRSERIDGAEITVPARGGASIRIDITSYVESSMKKGAPAWGLRIEGSGKGYGLPIATGFGKGMGPRVEVYVQ